ncbi:MAG: tetratricopeptide repeat protein, partial [Candidatus Margulisbacteria bacterium]|nr:tetratricopeptide repeat protein [Candidatus Margulisiibacteriota bacterium]
SGYYYLGSAYAGVNRPQLARKAFLLALDMPDWTYSIGMNVADYFESRGDPNQAVEIYQRLFLKFPGEKAETAQKMAKALAKQKKYRETINIFTGLIEADPKTANPLAYYVGVSYYTLNDLVQAEAYFQKAINADFRDPDLYLKQGELSVRKGQWQAGLDLLNNGLKLGGIIYTPEASAYKYIGQAYAKLDDSKSAADNFRKALQAGNKETDVYLQFAANASLNRDFRGVLEMLEPGAAAAANVKNAEYQYYLGSAYDNLNMTRQAIQYYQKALEAGYTNAAMVRARINELQQNEEN